MPDKKAETQATPQEAVFEAKELAENSPRLFGYSCDLAAAAFELAGVKTCSRTEAQKTIKEFAERKVN